MDVAVAAAKKHNIMIMFVLLDFSLLDEPHVYGKVQVGGHGELIRNPKLRRTFFDNALKPLLARYGTDGAIVAWEVMNEPEWATKVWGGGQKKQSVALFRMQEFVRETAEIVHHNSSQAVTVGCARRNWLFVWKGLGLDFYQYHYYPWMEVPTNNPADFRRYMNQALSNGYAGIMGWSYRATDPFSVLKDRVDDMDKWRADHPIRMQP
jgi:hypothetical protein